MPDAQVERATCPGCGQPIYRYRTVYTRKSPLEPYVTYSWWFHAEGQTFACDQAGPDA